MQTFKRKKHTSYGGDLQVLRKRTHLTFEVAIELLSGSLLDFLLKSILPLRYIYVSIVLHTLPCNTVRCYISPSCVYIRHCFHIKTFKIITSLLSRISLSVKIVKYLCAKDYRFCRLCSSRFYPEACCA